MAKEKRDKVTSQWKIVPTLMAKQNTSYMKSQFATLGEDGNMFNGAKRKSVESEIVANGTESKVREEGSDGLYPAILGIDPSSSIFVDNKMTKSLEDSARLKNSAQWSQGSTITVMRKYGSDQIAIFIDNKLVHEISSVPQTFMHPFIQISGAGVAVQLMNNMDLPSEKDDQYTAWSLENAILNETVYLLGQFILKTVLWYISYACSFVRKAGRSRLYSLGT